MAASSRVGSFSFMVRPEGPSEQGMHERFHCTTCPICLVHEAVGLSTLLKVVLWGRWGGAVQLHLQAPSHFVRISLRDTPASRLEVDFFEISGKFNCVSIVVLTELQVEDVWKQ